MKHNFQTTTEFNGASFNFYFIKSPSVFEGIKELLTGGILSMHVCTCVHVCLCILSVNIPTVCTQLYVISF